MDFHQVLVYQSLIEDIPSVQAESIHWSASESRYAKNGKLANKNDFNPSSNQCSSETKNKTTSIKVPVNYFEFHSAITSQKVEFCPLMGNRIDHLFWFLQKKLSFPKITNPKDLQKLATLWLVSCSYFVCFLSKGKQISLVKSRVKN